MAERVLVTGAGGLIGSFLAEALARDGRQVFATYHANRRNLGALPAQATLIACDLRQGGQVRAAMEQSRPEQVFHLAGQSSPSGSWTDPQTTVEVNVTGTLHLLDAVRAMGVTPVIVLAGSSAEYGPPDPAQRVIPETKTPQPNTPYGVSKLAATLLAQCYVRSHGLHVVIARPFFVIGPRKASDACSDFARAIVAVERGEQEAIRVGDLRPVRDFLDVQDAVAALRLLGHRGVSGEVYNVSSGHGRAVQEVLDGLIALSGRSIPVQQDTTRLRPVDQPVVIGDNARLRSLGWQPRMPLEQSLRAILAYWRAVS